ncbi:MAG: hypothetical protein L0229_00010 [Blastocatellia bacterium]|nr:hypothetical protein [Blastocatellia bacterium]
MIELRTAAVALLLTLVIAAGSGILPGARAQDVAPPDSGIVRTGAVEIAVKAGFDKLEISYFAGMWVPFRITITNAGEPITGRLIVRTESRPSPNSEVREFVKDVQLPTGSRQFHEIPVYVSSGHKAPEILLVSDGDVVAMTTVRVERTFGRNDRLEIAVVDTDSTTLSNITSTDIFQSPNRKPFESGPLSITTQDQEDSDGGGTGSGSGAGAPQGAQNPTTQNTPSPPQSRSSRRGRSNQQGLTARPIVIQSEDLPRDFVSYDSLDAVVIGDAPLSQLTEDQARALRLWVASGGLLVVTGAADVAGLRSSGLDDLLPAEAQGAVTSASLPELTDIYGGFDASEPLLIMSARARPGGRTLIGSADKSIVAERDYGSGLVRFVAYNPRLNPYRAWSGTRHLWTDLLLPAAEMKSKQSNNWIGSRRRRSPRSNFSGIQDFLFDLAQIEPPSANYFLLFLLMYILIVGPVNYLALRWMRRLELAWLTIPGVVILFTVVSVTVAQVSRGRHTVAADLSLVEAHQQEGTSQVIGSMLVMPVSKDTHEIAFDGRDTFANSSDSGPAMSATSDAVESQRDQREFRMRVPMNTWTANLFSLRSISEGARPLFSAEERTAAGPSVIIKNLTDAPITQAVYVSAAGLSSLFDLAPGEEKEITLSGPQMMAFADWYSAQLAQDSHEAAIFDNLEDLLVSRVGGEQVFRNGFFEQMPMVASLALLERPLLIGFVEKSPNKMSFSSSLKQRSKSLYVIHL